MINLTQHIATEEQLNDGVIEPSNKLEIQKLLTFDDIPTEVELINRAKQISKIAKETKEESAMIGGALYLMPYLIDELNKVGIKAYYSFSKRQSVDTIKEDGSVSKTLVFRHIGFILATLPKGE